MNRKQLIKYLGIITISFILLGIVIGLLSTQIIARQEYESIAKILGYVSRTAPELADTLVQALKEADATDFYHGYTILQQYHYSVKVFRSQTGLRMIAYGVLIMSFLAIVIMMIGYFSEKKRKARIDGVTNYLRSVNLGRDLLLVRQEDEFSHLEDELYKTVTELRETRENALRERQSLADNLADISHQLKTPITSMSLMAQLLWESCREEEAVYIEKLLHQLHRLETLVSSLLTLSRLDTGTLEFKEEPVDVFEMLTLAIEPIEDILLQKGQQLMFSKEFSANFIGDMSWTAEAFLNLIKNCSEHTPDGGIISICYSENPLYTEIMIEDGGSGFNKEDLPYLFQRFYKGKSSGKDSVGIGLSLAKSIIEKQKGTIHAENSPRGSARFIVKFYA